MKDAGGNADIGNRQRGTLANLSKALEPATRFLWVLALRHVLRLASVVRFKFLDCLLKALFKVV